MRQNRFDTDNALQIREHGVTLLVVGRGGRARRREYGILALEEEQMRVCAKHFGAPWLTVLFAELPECLLRSCQHPSFSSL